MTYTLEQEIVVCRPALLKDTEDVLELCSHIWDGGDYIHWYGRNGWQIQMDC
jgi:hypothetical protein